MKVLKRLFAVSLLGFLAACGGSDSTSTSSQGSCQSGYTYSAQYGCQVTGTTTGVYGATCSDGQVYSTTYGCMSRGSCQAGYGVATQTNSCQPASQTGSCSGVDVYSPSYGCIPQTGCASGMGMYNGSCVAAYNSATYSGATNSCAGGLYNSTYGCLTVSASCGPNYGLASNGSCQPSTGNTGGYVPGQPGYNNGVNNACPAGTFNTVQGCLSQGPCMQGQVLYNNQCYYLVQQGMRGYNGGGGFGFQIHLGF